MEDSDLTPRQYWEQIKANPNRRRFGFGGKAALINVDLQKAYTAVGEFETAYETNPRQLEYIDQLAAAARDRGWPVIWTHVAFMESGEDAGVWGTRTNTPNSLQNIKVGSERAKLDPRLTIDEGDVVVRKRMPSPFFETHIPSLLTWHRVDTVIITGGSTSGCVRACAVDSLSHGYRTIVVEECVADKHEIPHFANLCDLMLKYADVVPHREALAFLRGEERP